MKNEKFTTISIIIPCRNEYQYIGSLIDSLLNQKTKKRFEIIIVDGNSNDGTKNILKKYEANNNSMVRVFDNPKQKTPFAMNIGYKHTRGKYITLIGAHSSVNPTYLADLILVFEKMKSFDSNTAGVGGVFENKNKSAFAKTTFHVMNSFWGGGISKYRFTKVLKKTKTIVFGFYEKATLEQLDYFVDENLFVGQDLDLNLRLSKKGYSLYTTPKIAIGYYSRNTCQSLWKQMYNYGKARADILVKYNKKIFVPLLIVATTIAIIEIHLLLFLLPLFLFLNLGLIFAYMSIITYSSHRIKKTYNTPFFITLLIHLLIHFSFGLGFFITYPKDIIYKGMQ